MILCFQTIDWSLPVNREILIAKHQLNELNFYLFQWEIVENQAATCALNE